MVSTKDVKEMLRLRIEAVSRPDFLDARVRPLLGAGAGTNGSWKTSVVQLDGTGAATLEIKLGTSARAFAKLYHDGSGLKIHEKLQALRASGLGAGEPYQSVEPLGFLPDYEMLLTRPAEGSAVSDHIGADPGALKSGAFEAGRWLARLHKLDVVTGPAKTLLEAGELLPLARRLSKMLARRPEFLDLALELIEALEKLAERTREGLMLLSHGQYRPIHVFISKSAVMVIDLDRSRPCDPARDIAEFLHRMRMTTFWRTGSVAAADPATRAFLEGYLSGGAGPSNLANLPFHWARYVFHSLNNKLKGDKCDPAELEATTTFYRTEFALAAQGRFLDGL